MNTCLQQKHVQKEDVLKTDDVEMIEWCTETGIGHYPVRKKKNPPTTRENRQQTAADALQAQTRKN